MKYKSRPVRWAEAIQKARDAIATAQSEIDDAFSDLRDLQSEYQDWLDNLAEVAQGTTTEEYLQNVTGLDLEPDSEDMSAVNDALDEAESVDLPRGFGRD